MIIGFMFLVPVMLVWGLVMAVFPEGVVEKAGFPTSPEPQVAGAMVFAALPDDGGEMDYGISEGDARPIILRNFLEEFDSPLVGLEDEIIEASDAYDLDFRLLAAIARQESGLCEFAPEGTFNCWGWGIHKRGTLGFDSYEEGIWTVARGLREDYLDAGLVTPEELMSRYTPSSNGSWAWAVRQFMEEME